MVVPGEDERIKAFGMRLTRLVTDKGWSGADLAREASRFLPPGPKGKKQEMGRHLPSAYMRGLNYPSGSNLEAIAKALDVAIDVILVGASEQSEHRSFVNVSSSDGGTARLTLDAVVDEDTALQIMKLVREGQEKAKARAAEKREAS